MKFVTVRTLAEAERIVSRNKQLSWDGWNIVHMRPDKTAFTKLKGVFKDGRWWFRNVYTPEADGWTLPSDLIRS